MKATTDGSPVNGQVDRSRGRCIPAFPGFVAGSIIDSVVVRLACGASRPGNASPPRDEPRRAFWCGPRGSQAWCWRPRREPLCAAKRPPRSMTCVSWRPPARRLDRIAAGPAAVFTRNGSSNDSRLRSEHSLRVSRSVSIGAGGQSQRENRRNRAPAASTTGRDAGRLGSLTAKTQQLPPPLELGTKVTK